MVNTEIPGWTVSPVRDRGDGQFELDSGLVLPYQGTVGSFGCAPAAGGPTNAIGPTCGTSDLPHATVGAKLHVPIEVAGGLFSLGDVHACQARSHGRYSHPGAA